MLEIGRVYFKSFNVPPKSQEGERAVGEHAHNFVQGLAAQK
jgi:hypothetical protein